jgi:hypothetical protein
VEEATAMSPWIDKKAIQANVDAMIDDEIAAAHMGMSTFGHLARLSALRAQFSALRDELANTTDETVRARIFDDAVATLRRIRELEAA